MKYSVIVQLLTLWLPSFLKISIYRILLKWDVGDGVKIGLSIIGSENVKIGKGVQISHFNIVKQMRRFELGDHTYILRANFFGGNGKREHRPSTFIAGAHVGIMSRHHFDCGNEIRIGDYSVVAGRDVHFWTHSRKRVEGNPNEFTHVSYPICIGSHCYIGARSTLYRTRLPDACMVGAGSIVVGDFSDYEKPITIVGNPCKALER